MVNKPNLQSAVAINETGISLMLKQVVVACKKYAISCFIAQRRQKISHVKPQFNKQSTTPFSTKRVEISKYYIS